MAMKGLMNRLMNGLAASMLRSGCGHSQNSHFRLERRTCAETRPIPAGGRTGQWRCDGGDLVGALQFLPPSAPNTFHSPGNLTGLENKVTLYWLLKSGPQIRCFGHASIGGFLFHLLQSNDSPCPYRAGRQRLLLCV